MAEEEEEVELIPGLPEDVALECLLRVPYKYHSQLLAVCRRWEKVVSAAEFYELRRKVSSTSHSVCLIQALPVAQSSKEKLVAAPVYAVTVYDLREGRWERLPPIPDFPQGMPLFCHCLAFQGSLFILGGWNPTTWQAMKSVYKFTFSTRSWTRCADMLTVRSFFACGADKGLLYVAGGHDESKNALTSAEVYSIQNNRWQMLPPLSQQRDECSGHFLDGKFYVISGYATDSQGQFCTSADVYDPAAACWRRIEDLWSLGLCPSASLVFAGQLNAFHGQHMLRYQATSNSWTRLDAVPEPAKLAPRAVAVQGSIFLTGSLDGHATCFMYKLKPGVRELGIGEWTPVPAEEAFTGVTQASCALEI